MSSMRHRDELKKLLQLPGNGLCADCKCSRSLEWASINLGVFICTDCVSIHRSMGVHVSKVKSIFLDEWSDTAIQLMSDNGNAVANNILEKHIPIFFPRISSLNIDILREHWIRAKYEDRLFNGEKNSMPLSKSKRGFLFKRGKSKNEWNQRLFVLSDDSKTLSYYITEKDLQPKCTLNVNDIDITLISKQKIGRPYGLQLLATENDGKTRNYFMYAETGKDLMSWVSALRIAKADALGYLYRKLSEDEEDKISRILSTQFLYEGYLEKTGPKENGAFRRRWFSLYEKKMMYFKNPLEPYSLGDVDIGPREKGYRVQEDDIASHQRLEGFFFVFKTPGRNYYLKADSAGEKRKWMKALNDAMDAASNLMIINNLTG